LQRLSAGFFLESVVVIIEEEDNMSTADKDRTGDDVLALME
jgi:hypothetical protein